VSLIFIVAFVFSAQDIQCPKEYAFNLDNEIRVPYNLERMKLLTTSHYDCNGFTLAVGKISELETNIVRPEIKVKKKYLFRINFIMHKI
jgi:hypothetical protein